MNTPIVQRLYDTIHLISPRAESQEPCGCDVGSDWKQSLLWRTVHLLAFSYLYPPTLPTKVHQQRCNLLVQPKQSSLISALRKRRMSGTCVQGIISIFGSSAKRNSTLDYVMLMDLQWSVPICESKRPRARVCPAVYSML